MRRSHSRASWALTLTLVAATARAQDVGSILEVLEEEVVTGASRSAERAGDAPATSVTITAEELRRYGIRDMEEALNFLSLGMFAHRRQSTAEVGARGMAVSRDANGHVLVVLDGMVVNEQGGGAVYLHDVPMELVDHIEVILGPGSVLYGAQAMLGVINVVTKRPKDHEGLHATGSFGASPTMDGGGSADLGRWTGHDNRYSLSLGRTFELLGLRGGLVAGLDYSDFDGPNFHYDKQEMAGVDLGPHAAPGYWGGQVRDQWYARTLGGYTRLELGDLTWTTRATTTRLGMPQQDLFESRAPSAYDDTRNTNDYQLLLSDVRYEKRLSARVSGLARTYFGYSARENSRFVIGHEARLPGVPLGVIDPEQCPAGPTGPCRKDAYFYSRWLGVELQSTFDWLGDGAYTTLVGVDARTRTAAYEFVTFDELTGSSYGSDPGLTRWHAGGYAQADEHAVGAYLQQTLRPTSFLAFNAGLRADVDSRIGAEYTDEALSPRAALIVNPLDSLSVKLIYSKAFRAPSFLEQNIVNGRLLPNANGLEPETVSSYELATTVRFSRNSLTTGCFYADWRNLIELRVVDAQAPAVSRFENVSDVRNYGAFLNFDGAVMEGRLRFGLNTMLTSAERVLRDEQQERNERFGTGDTVPMTVAPRVLGNARASYALFGDHAVSLTGGYLGTRTADQAYVAGDPTNLSPVPTAPPQLELQGALTGTVPKFTEARYSLGARYAFSSSEPFVVGPNQGLPRYLNGTEEQAELAKVNRLTVFAGLEFHLDASDRKTESTAASASGGATR